MKILTALLLFIPLISSAQIKVDGKDIPKDITHLVIIEMYRMGSQVYVDYGQGVRLSKKPNVLDTEGNPYKSGVALLNVLTKDGWEVVTFSQVGNLSAANTKYLLKREEKKI